MDKTRLEEDLAISESKHTVSRKNLPYIMLALLFVIALFFAFTVFSLLSEHDRRIKSLEHQIKSMQGELESIRTTKRGE